MVHQVSLPGERRPRHEAVHSIVTERPDHPSIPHRVLSRDINMPTALALREIVTVVQWLLGFHLLAWKKRKWRGCDLLGEYALPVGPDPEMRSNPRVR